MTLVFNTEILQKQIDELMRNKSSVKESEKKGVSQFNTPSKNLGASLLSSSLKQSATKNAGSFTQITRTTTSTLITQIIETFFQQMQMLRENQKNLVSQNSSDPKSQIVDKNFKELVRTINKLEEAFLEKTTAVMEYKSRQNGSGKYLFQKALEIFESKECEQEILNLKKDLLTEFSKDPFFFWELFKCLEKDVDFAKRWGMDLVEEVETIKMAMKQNWLKLQKDMKKDTTLFLLSSMLPMIEFSRHFAATFNNRVLQTICSYL
eukprot:CAMPEP_0176466816 /NCGR_PEP_ID=MMETSP0127-20121128/38117_1 /TAXON_ID=938130 /ORGANISM="Platyophrya macrostoma, Strain WH" /LENGTH=263 /DNA_ID=CAMNT_0017860055 /DNA_START=15 /DNA_END=806 /DNA_ORIENTATION=-